MPLLCPQCVTSYQIDPSSLGPTGRQVRCVRCRHTWFASNTQAIEQISLAHRGDLAALRRTSAPPADPPFEEPAAPLVQDLPPTVAAPAENLPALIEPPPLAPTVQSDMDAPLPKTLENEGREGEITAFTDAPPTVPADSVRIAVSEPVDIESVAARRKSPPRRTRRRRAPILAWPSVILALIAINAGIIAWRTEIVGWLPQTASLFAAIKLPVNVRGLAFTDLAIRKETQDGVLMLVVEGFIKNETGRSASVPRLRFAVRNAQGVEIYAWISLPARSVIPPGAMLPFRSRLASPPPEAHDALVRFLNRRDLTAGA